MYVDADWAGDKISRKSTNGVGIGFYSGGFLATFDTVSKLQTITAASTPEAEYVTLVYGMKKLALPMQVTLEGLVHPQDVHQAL